MAPSQVKAGIIIFGLFAVLCENGCQAGSYYRRGSLVPATDANGHDNTTSCVRVKPSHRGYCYHGVKVAKCEALEELREETEELEDKVDTLRDEITVQDNDLSDQVDDLRSQADDLLGEDKEAGFIILTKLGDNVDRRFVCQVNSELEAAEICRRPRVFYFHLDCNDPRVASAGATCPNTTWVFSPGCVLPGGDLFACATDPPEGFTCKNLLLLSCNGFVSLPDAEEQEEGEEKTSDPNLDATLEGATSIRKTNDLRFF